MSVIDLPEFETLKPFIKIEFAADTRNSRHRIELIAPPWARRLALSLTMGCVKCGVPMHPFRNRGGGHIYFAATCPLQVNIACSRAHDASSLEYARVLQACQ